MTRSNKTSILDIVDYWSERIDECDIGVDWAEAEERCWRCGAKKELVRCHIIPHELGGKDNPSNYVVLCRSCHEENPNVSDPEIMWDWLMAYASAYHDNFWIIEGIREYKYMYRRTVEEDWAFLIEHGLSLEQDMREEVLRFCIANSGIHFGQAFPNKATIAGLIRMFFKDQAGKIGIQLPDERRPSSNRRREMEKQAHDADPIEAPEKQNER